MDIIKTISDKVAEVTGTRKDQFYNMRDRTPLNSHKRWAAWYILHIELGVSLSDIVDYFNCGVSTVNYGIVNASKKSFLYYVGGYKEFKNKVLDGVIKTSYDTPLYFDDSYKFIY